MRKRSLLKKFVAAAATAAVLIGAMGTTAAASGYGGTGDTKGSITVHKYSKVTQATTTNPTGEELTSTAGLGTPLSGAGYTLYKLTMPTLTSGQVLTDVYTTSISSDKATATVTINLAGGGTVQATAAKAAGESYTDATGTVVFGTGSTLDQGYYLLVESTVPAGYTADDPTIISLPLTNAAGTGYVYDVHVYPKNVSSIPITKILDDTSKTYAVGDDIGFTIDAAFQNDEAAPNKVDSIDDLKAGSNYGVMRVTDTLVGSLVYDSSKVYYLTETNKKIELTPVADYTLTTTGSEYVWALTNTGIDKIINNEATEGKGVTLEINIQATVQISDEALTNKASSFVKKANATTDPIKPPTTPDVIVPTGEVVVNKTMSDNTALAGAEFALATNAAATSFLLVDGTTVDNITSLAQLQAEIATRKAAGNPLKEIVVATTVVKGTQGYAVFSGLPYDKTAGTTYRLVEVAAPSGYQLKEAAVNADLPDGIDAGKLATVTATIKNYRTDEVDPDNPKFSLPLTGGTGTLLFTIIGLLIMAATVIVYIHSKKKTNA